MTKYRTRKNEPNSGLDVQLSMDSRLWFTIGFIRHRPTFALWPWVAHYDGKIIGMSPTKRGALDAIKTASQQAERTGQ